MYISPLTTALIPQAVELDRKWFGDKGISAPELTKLITDYPDSAIALVEGQTLHGFATFEVLDNRLPTDFVGEMNHANSVLFIYQFTTRTNYSRADWSVDTALLAAVEEQARKLDVAELAEALDAHHPYSKEQNPEFDAFGFYEAHGFHTDETAQLAWQPDSSIKIKCRVVRKTI